MKEIVWLALGAVALLLTVSIVAGGRTGRLEPSTGVVASAAGTGVWFVWIIHAFNVSRVEVTQCCAQTISNSYPAMAWLGLVGAGFCVLGLYRASVASLGSGDGTSLGT